MRRLIETPGASLVARYIRIHRDRLAPRGLPLTEAERAALQPYFPAGDLDRARLVQADPLPLRGAYLSAAASSLGWSAASPGLIEAITFDHVIAARNRLTASVLFHELVHVTQYRLLGIRAFARLYTSGFLRTRSYANIPLERCAYELQARYDCGSVSFDVEAEVQRWMDGGRL